MVARNPNSAKKATSYAERLRLGIAVIHGEQKESESDEVDGRNSPPAVPRSRTMDVPDSVPIHPAKEKPPMNVVGDVGGRIAIMVVSNLRYKKRIGTIILSVKKQLSQTLLVLCLLIIIL